MQMSKIFSKLNFFHYKKYVKPRKLVLAVDFDGTITENSDDWPEVKTLKANVKDVINELHDNYNCEIIIWTCRDNSVCDDLTYAKEFLTINNIHYDYINENSKALMRKWGSDSRKIFYDILVDDKATLGETVDWIKVLNYVKKFKEQNTKKYI